MTQTYSIEQAELITYVRSKVADLFAGKPVPAHNFDHAERVAENAIEIAKREGFKSIFLAELAALLHDVGRVPEFHDPTKKGIRHHELSYETLQVWFNQDERFSILSREDKIELLYAVRYHWNNAADEYELAWILRDADKIDMFGLQGIERAKEFSEGFKIDLQTDIRMKYDSLYWVRTDSAKQLIEERGLIQEQDAYYIEYLRSFIDPVVL